MTEAQWRALLDGVLDLVFTFDRAGVYKGVKADRLDDLVVPPHELLGRSVHEMLPAAVAERIMAGARHALETGELTTVDYELTLNGEVRSFEGRIIASSADGFLLIARDFTDRVRQEQELQRLAVELEERVTELGRERDFTRTIVRSVPIFLALLDANGGVLGLNVSLEHATGYSTAEATTRPFWEALLPEENWAQGRELFSAITEGREPPVRELELVTRDGSLRLVEWSGAFVTDQFGLPRSVLSGVDVTDRVQQEAEVRESRARIVAAADAERRRLERNLHDGAQQQLVAALQGLRMSQRLLETSPDQAATLLQSSIDLLSVAYGELREIARGLRPVALSERGLGPALRQLADRCLFPVTLDLDNRRFPDPIETALYYVAAEALTNVTKYAAATEARMVLEHTPRLAILEVHDDGVGGADPAAGTGLAGLRDRVESLGGRFSLESPAGAGTRLRAELPL